VVVGALGPQLPFVDGADQATEPVIVGALSAELSFVDGAAALLEWGRYRFLCVPRAFVVIPVFFTTKARRRACRPRRGCASCGPTDRPACGGTRRRGRSKRQRTGRGSVVKRPNGRFGGRTRRRRRWSCPSWHPPGSGRSAGPPWPDETVFFSGFLCKWVRRGRGGIRDTRLGVSR